MDINVDDLKEKAENSNKVIDKLNYVYYYLIPKIESYDNTTNDIFYNIKEEIKMLVEDTKLTKNISKKTYDNYINCKEKALFIQQLLFQYEKTLSTRNVTYTQTNKDLSNVIIGACLTGIEDMLKQIVEFIKRENRKIQNNKKKIEKIS